MADRTRRTALAAWALAALIAGACAAGCDQRQPGLGAGSPPAEIEAPERTEDAPEIPGDEDDSEDAGSPILVKPLPPGVKRHAESYTRDEKMSCGALLALCYIPAKKPQRLPRPAPVDITGGPNAIVDPEPKELAYYKRMRFQRPGWIDRFNGAQGGHPVLSAVILLRGVDRGPRAPLTRGSFLINNGVLKPLIGFSAAGDRIELRTYDAFSNRFVIREWRRDRTILRKALPGNTATYRGSGALDKSNLGSWEMTQWMKLAKPIQTDPIREPGFFEIRCERHPWQTAYLVVYDNPYVGVSSSRGRARGTCSVGQIPVGTWTLDVWHPLLEPVRRTHTVEIKQDETTELLIPFKLPGGTP